jgi:hypothetical protein
VSVENTAVGPCFVLGDIQVRSALLMFSTASSQRLAEERWC